MQADLARSLSNTAAQCSSEFQPCRQSFLLYPGKSHASVRFQARQAEQIQLNQKENSPQTDLRE
jgi:hypothetical protein